MAAETRVVLGDSMGELFAYYAACDVAFVGGSLLPLGGQNLLEACAVGKPVVIGPHTFNFAEATRLAVDAGAAIQVADAHELGVALATLLGDSAPCRTMGAAGRALMLEHQGATARTLGYSLFPLAIRAAKSAKRRHPFTTRLRRRAPGSDRTRGYCARVTVSRRLTFSRSRSVSLPTVCFSRNWPTIVT